MKIFLIVLIFFFAAFSVAGQSDPVQTKTTAQPTPSSSTEFRRKEQDFELLDKSFTGERESEAAEEEKIQAETEIIAFTGEYFGICTIAYEYRTTCEKLAEYNGVDYKVKLPPGTRVKIPITPELREFLKKLDELRARAGVSFRQGLLDIQKNRAVAGNDFDNSVEVFLRSGFNLTRNAKIFNCFNQLVETIYRIEFPGSASPPQIRSLSAVCEWNWNDNDYRLADLVVKNEFLSRPEILPGKPLPAGFNEQEFAASPLDELARLELTPEEALPAVRKSASSRPLLKNITVMTETAVSKPAVTKVTAGPRPAQSKDGKISIVMNFFNEVLNDPYSMRFVRWNVVESRYEEIPCWRVYVKYRAKNLMGAYVLIEHVFYIRQDKIIKNIKLN